MYEQWTAMAFLHHLRELVQEFHRVDTRSISACRANAPTVPERFQRADEGKLEDFTNSADHE